MFRLYLDEVGHDDLTHVDQENHRYLSLTATIVNLNHVADELIPRMNDLKARVFDCDPDDPPINLHRTDIVKRKKIFGQLNENPRRHLFDASISSLIADTEYTVITGFIDKRAMLRQRHWEQKHPYLYLMEIILEKYVQFLERQDDIGDIMPEARNKKSDELLQQAFSELKDNGTRYRGIDQIQARVRANKLKFRKKTDNVAGLQLCDLVAHPSHMYIRSLLEHEVQLGDFGTMVVGFLTDQKYDRSRTGKINGYGIKSCP